MNSTEDGSKGVLTRNYKKYVLVENGIGPTITNILINGVITSLAFLGFKGGDVPANSIRIDLWSTGFLIPFITMLLAYSVSKKQIKKGNLIKLPNIQGKSRSSFFDNVWVRAFILSAGIVLLFVPITLLMVDSDMSYSDYIYFKGFWAGGVALCSAPIAGWWSLRIHSAT